jgi:NhaP-type Na+/H+ or K+/H+ antiporter
MKKQLTVLTISVLVGLFSAYNLGTKFKCEGIVAMSVIGIIFCIFGLFWFANLVLKQKEDGESK